MSNSTIPAPPPPCTCIVKQCGCSRDYTADEWAQLPRMVWADFPQIDCANCEECGSTIAIPKDDADAA